MQMHKSGNLRNWGSQRTWIGVIGDVTILGQIILH